MEDLYDGGMLPEVTCRPKFVSEGNGKVGNGVIYAPINVHITKSPNRKIEYLVIHYTAGGSSKVGTAERTRNVFLQRNASADFVVDDGSMVQINPDPANYFCWAVGDGKGMYGVTNKNAISIEICSNLTKGTSAAMPNHNGWYFTEETLKNALLLSRMLMDIYNIPIDKVIRHYDASRKACPGLVGWNDGTLYSVDGKRTGKMNTSEKWLEFKSVLANG